MVRKSWICDTVLHSIIKGTESTCSSRLFFSSLYWHLLMQRSTTKASKSFRLEIVRDIAVVDHLVLRVSSQLRRGCTCSNTFTATLSRWPYMVTPYPTAQSVFNKCFYTKENVAIINRYKKIYQMICRHSGCGHIGCFCVKDPSPRNWSCLEEPHEI